MTLAEATTEVRELTRTSSSALTDAQIMVSVNDGQREFGKEAHGLIKEGYLALAPSFDTATNFAIRLTITGGDDALAATDIALTGTARLNTTGTIVASDLETTVQAAGASSTTVTWSTTDWTFTITAPANTTSITLASPSGITYVDALNLLGMNATTTTGRTVNDNIPTDCTVETALPDDYISLIPPVEWDDEPLAPANFDVFASPGYSGTPEWWGIRNDRIAVLPYPTSQKKFKIWYLFAPTSFTDAAAQVAVELYTPAHYHMAVVYYAASIVSEKGFEMRVSDRYLARFKEHVNKYVTAKANSNTKMEPGEQRVQWFRVII